MLLEHPSLSRFVQTMGIALLVFASLLGLPRRCTRIAAAWEENLPGAINRFVLKNASPSDVVYSENWAAATYYPLRPIVRAGYWGHLPVNQAELPKINVAFMSKTGEEARLHELLGGNWQQVDGQEFGAQKLNFFLGERFLLAAYRRS